MKNSQRKTQERKKNKAKVRRKVHNIIHNNITPKMRRFYYPISNKMARMIIFSLILKLSELERGFHYVSKKDKKVEKKKVRRTKKNV